AVDSIRHSLIAIQGEKHRLKRIATLHAWLIPRRVHKQWFLYNLNISSSTLDNVAFGEALVKTLQCAGWIVADATLNTGTSMCVTVLAIDKGYRPPQYKPICFAIWPGLSFVAIHAPGMTLDAPPDSPDPSAFVPYWAGRAYGPFEGPRGCAYEGERRSEVICVTSDRKTYP
ncbi:hypothetical protein MTO96_045997, partial [Rhipicephalus appendiculatus]